MLTVIEKVLLVQELELFRFAYSEHLAQLAAVSREVRLSRDSVLFREGDEARQLHLLVRGKVAYFHGEQRVETTDRGGLGFWSFFSENSHQVTARAMSDCTSLIVSYEDMVDLLTAEPEFCWAISKYLAEGGRREVSRRLELLGDSQVEKTSAD